MKHCGDVSQPVPRVTGHLFGDIGVQEVADGLITRTPPLHEQPVEGFDGGGSRRTLVCETLELPNPISTLGRRRQHRQCRTALPLPTAASPHCFPEKQYRRSRQRHCCRRPRLGRTLAFEEGAAKARNQIRHVPRVAQFGLPDKRPVVESLAPRIVSVHLGLSAAQRHAVQPRYWSPRALDCIGRRPRLPDRAEHSL